MFFVSSFVPVRLWVLIMGKSDLLRIGFIRDFIVLLKVDRSLPHEVSVV